MPKRVKVGIPTEPPPPPSSTTSARFDSWLQDYNKYLSDRSKDPFGINTAMQTGDWNKVELPGMSGQIRNVLPGRWLYYVRDPRNFEAGFITSSGKYVNMVDANKRVHEEMLKYLVEKPAFKNLNTMDPKNYFPSRMADEGILQARRYMHDSGNMKSVAAYAKMTPEQQEALMRWLRATDDPVQLNYWLGATPTQQGIWGTAPSLSGFLRWTGAK